MIWKERDMPSPTRSCDGLRVTSLPSNRIRPAVGRRSPVRQWKVVVLPAPLGPMMQRSSPSSMVRLRLLMALKPPLKPSRGLLSNSASI